MVVNEVMTSASPAHGREAFSASGLDALVAAAARDCPDRVLVRDDTGASTAGELARRIGRLAALLQHAGFVPGEHVLIAAGATTGAIVALVASLRAGLEPALMPVGLGPIEIAAYAQAAGAAALIGPSRYGVLELGETYLSAAALADSIRMIATQGPDAVDGAADVSFERLDTMIDVSSDGLSSNTAEPPAIATFEWASGVPTLVTHRQAVLFADALSLVEQARINPSVRIVSTVPPASLAGLVAGPCAALIGAAGLTLHGPFDGTRFLAACDVEPSFHLVAPAAIGRTFEDGALTVDMASLVLVSRFASSAAFVPPPPVQCDRAVIDVYAFGEHTVLAQRRVDGHAQPPSRVTDRSEGGGLGARLNRARAEHRLYGVDGA